MYLALLLEPVRAAFTITSAGHVDHDVECFQLSLFLFTASVATRYLGTENLLVGSL